MIKNLKINFKDKRGIILDIFTKNPKDHCTLVSFNKNTVRGNHYHKKSIQYSFILEGSLTMCTCKVNKSGKFIGKIKKKIVKKFDLIKHDAYVSHAFKSLNKSKILAFADGVRGGKSYEKDTYRLVEKLIK